jgi:amidase
MPAPRHKRIRDFRVGYVLDDPDVPVASDVREVYVSLFERLRGAGVNLVEGWPDGADAQRQFTTYRDRLDSLLGATRPADPTATAARPHVRWYEATCTRTSIRSAWRRWFEHHDIFLMPVAFTAAFPHDYSPRDENTLGRCTRVIQTVDGPRPYRDLLYWFSMASVAGLPATVAPAGFTRSGLPCGIQIVGPMWEDSTPIEFAALLEDIAGGFTAPFHRPGPRAH